MKIKAPWHFWRKKPKAIYSNSEKNRQLDDGGFIPSGGIFDGNLRGATRNGAIVTCVHRITARAQQTKFATDDAATQAILASPSWHEGQSPIDFWREAFETYLYTGNCFLHLEGGKFRIATGATSSRGEKGWTLTFKARDKLSTDNKNVLDNAVALARWSPAYASSPSAQHFWLSPSPLSVIEVEADAYQKIYYQQKEWGGRANRIGDVMKQIEAYADQDKVEERRDEVAAMLSQAGHFRSAASDRGFEFTRLPTAAPPDYGREINAALAGVARVYGVPMQFLQVADQRQDMEQAEAHLVRDAVSPMLSVFASALATLFGVDVMVDWNEVGNPTRGALGDLATKYAQAGIWTINELRELTGKEPLPEGDKLPEVAGTTERNKEGKQNPMADDKQSSKETQDKEEAENDDE